MHILYCHHNINIFILITNYLHIQFKIFPDFPSNIYTYILEFINTFPECDKFRVFPLLQNFK